MKQKIRGFLLFLFITLFLYGCAGYPILKNYLTVPKGYFYYPTESMALDFLGYLTIVEKGYEGKWQGYFNHWIDPKLREQQTFTIAQIEYVALGHLAKIVHVEPYVMMIISRVVLSFIFFLVVWWISSKMFSTLWKQIVTYIFFLFATSITLPFNVAEMTMPVVFFFIGNTFERYIMTKQHHILAGITFFPALYFLSRSIDGKKWKFSLFLGSVFLLLSSHFYSPGIVIFCMVFGVSLMYRFFIKSFRKNFLLHWKRYLISSITIAIVTILPIIHISQTVKLFYPTEKYGFIWSGHFLYMLAVGTLYLLALIGVPKMVKSESFMTQYSGFFILLHPVIAVLFQPILQRSMRRTFEIPYQLFFAFGAVYGTTVLIKFLSQKFHIKQSIGIIVCIAFVLVPSIKTYFLCLQPDCFCNLPPFDYGYPKTEYMDVFKWLKEHTKPTDVILSGHHSGTLIGAFAGNEVITNWWMRMEDVNYWEYDLLREFYPRRNMTDRGAQKLLEMYDAKYVFYGEEEKTLSKGVDRLGYYPFLKLAYESGGTKIYKFIE
jgi:hypothetical protein